MQVAVSDTGPINYLVLIGCDHILPVLFDRIIMPGVVAGELAGAPLAVREWLIELPTWIEVRNSVVSPKLSRSLHKGEQAAIALASELNADLLLTDDWKAVVAARHEGLRVIGTLGFLQELRRGT